MKPSIRLHALQDLDTLYVIPLEAGMAGGDVSHLYEDPILTGQADSASYLLPTPDFALKVEGVAGYVVGVPDSQAWD